MKKVIAEGYEFYVRECNMSVDTMPAHTIRGDVIMNDGYYDVELRLESRISFEESREIMDLIHGGRAVIVVKR